MKVPIVPGAALLAAATLFLGLVPSAAVERTPDHQPGSAVTSAGSMAAAPAAVDDLMILLDVSGSMADPDDGGTIKIEGAKTGIISLVNTLPTGTRTALSTYPGGGSDCGAPTNVIGLSPLDPGAFTRTVAALPDPVGATPTALALRSAAASLDASGSPTATIVLVSDGESNCDEDPCETARQLATGTHALTVNTVGFDIGDDGRAELQCIADATGGRYFDAVDSAALGDALEQAARPDLSFTVSAPTDDIPVTQRTVEIRATVSVAGNITANDVQVSLVPDVVDSDQAFAVVGPVRRLGSVGPARPTVDVLWSVTPHQTSASSVSRLTFSVRAANHPALHQSIQLSFGDRTPGGELAGTAFEGMDDALVLGDSFSSGEGADDTARPYSDQGAADCHRTLNQYAGWIFDPSHVRVLACSGATSENLTGDGQHGESGQLDQLKAMLTGGYRPDVVFLSIGGNDAGFADIVKQCVLTNLAQGVLAVGGAVSKPLAVIDMTADAIAWLTGTDYLNFCPVQQESPWYNDKMDQLSAVAGGLDDTYAAVAMAFADSGLATPPIVVVPYPVLVPLDAKTRGLCMPSIDRFQNVALSLSQIDEFLDFQLRFNALIEDAAQRAREHGDPVYYADDVAWAFQPDHSLCSAHPWLNPITLSGAVGGSPELVHPSRDGHRAMAIELQRWSQKPGLELKPVSVTPSPAGPTWWNSLLSGTQSGVQHLTVLGQSSMTAEFGRVELSLDGLVPDSPVTALAHSEPVVLGVGRADAAGHAVVQATLDPAALPAGSHELRLLVVEPGGPAVRTVPLDVAAHVPVPVLVVGLAGLVSVLAGVALLLVARAARRRDRRAAAVP